MKRTLSYFLLAAFAGIWLFSCKPKISDQDIEAKVNPTLPCHILLFFQIKGLLQLSSEAKDETDRTDIEAAVKGIEELKQVVNNITIAPPPPPAPVEIAADDRFNKGIADALKDFPSVKATAMMV